MLEVWFMLSGQQSPQIQPKNPLSRFTYDLNLFAPPSSRYISSLQSKQSWTDSFKVWRT
jgi:hypothetical protein